LNTSIHEVKDKCRRNLNKYTIKAFSFIPEIDNPLILDIGCGTGEPTLALAEHSNGHFYAVDADISCISFLKEKVNTLNYADRIEVIHASVFDIDIMQKFDVVIAEGLLNVIGFEEGLPILTKFLKQKGYLIIHDELHNDVEKKALFQRHNLELLNSFELDESIWWNDYYFYLEHSIKHVNKQLLFAAEIKEIEDFKKNPQIFRSIYYVLQK